MPAFALDFEGVGWFPGGDGAATLWAGVTAGPGLLAPHAAVAAGLAGHGFRPEDRPNRPHVTLARCGPGVPGRVVEEFVAQAQGFTLPGVAVTEIGLYSSTFVDDVPVYRRDRAFTLRAAAE